MSFDKQQNTGASLAATGLSSATPIEPVPVSPVPASIPSAEALVELMVAWGNVPSERFHKRYPFFKPMRDRMIKDYGFHASERGEATLCAFSELADMLHAQAIEARRAETRSGLVHESAVANGDAPDTPALEASSRQEERLREALEPFSRAMGNCADDTVNWPDSDTIEFSGADEHITWGDLRRARAALEPPHSAKDQK